MGRSLQDALDWSVAGTTVFRTALDGLTEEGAAAPSALPGWSRKHVLAHVAANAEAIGNLVQWAATGVRTPMYSSPTQRAADIEAGSGRPLGGLVERFDRSAVRLAEAMQALTEEQWQAEVVTAQGRTVSAAETPWMRAREVLVHAVDLGTGTTFADLPPAFLIALADEIAAKRTAGGGPALDVVSTAGGHRWTVTGDGTPVTVTGSLADVTAYLAGRPAHVTVPDGGPVPTLPAWL